MLSETANKRLGMLIRYMKKLPKSANDHFSMGVWFWHGGDHEHSFKPGRAVQRRDLASCGTKSCALGWAAMIPTLKKAGLSVHHSSGIGDVTWKGVQMDPFDAASHCFDIDRSKARYLFLHICADTPKEWAAKALVKLKEWGTE